MKKDEKKIKKVLRNPCNLSLCPYRQRDKPNQTKQTKDMTTKNETFAEYKKRIATEFANDCKQKGFDAYLAKRGTYGFISDGKRVISFQVDLILSLSGNYTPSIISGTGWKMKNGISIEEAMTTDAPRWANTNPVYTTPDEYLAMYQKSSEYVKL
jgi:hypothetical protein